MPAANHLAQLLRRATAAWQQSITRVANSDLCIAGRCHRQRALDANLLADSHIFAVVPICPQWHKWLQLRLHMYVQSTVHD
jgi:hypothetical protein